MDTELDDAYRFDGSSDTVAANRPKLVVEYTEAGGATYTLALDAGSYTLTGQAATLAASRLLSLDAGSYTVTGQDVELLASRLLALDSGSYTLTGQDATLTYNQLGGYTLELEAGNYTLTGHDATLLVSRVLALDAGAYVVTGNDAELLRTYLLEADAGSYTVTGQDAAMVVSRVLGLDAGSYALTGRDATLTYYGAFTGIEDFTAQVRVFSFAAGARDGALVLMLVDQADEPLQDQNGELLLDQPGYSGTPHAATTRPSFTAEDR